MFALHPQNEDVMIQSGRDIIRACGLQVSVNVSWDEVNSMREWLAKWCEQRSDRVTAAVVSPSVCVRVSFLTKGEQFDFDLADEIAELSRELPHQFNHTTRLEVLRSTNRHQKTYDKYHPLSTMSRTARSMENPRGKVPWSVIDQQVLRRYLCPIEESVNKLTSHSAPFVPIVLRS